MSTHIIHYNQICSALMNIILDNEHMKITYFFKNLLFYTNVVSHNMECGTRYVWIMEQNFISHCICKTSSKSIEEIQLDHHTFRPHPSSYNILMRKINMIIYAIIKIMQCTCMFPGVSSPPPQKKVKESRSGCRPPPL